MLQIIADILTFLHLGTEVVAATTEIIENEKDANPEDNPKPKTKLLK